MQQKQTMTACEFARLLQRFGCTAEPTTFFFFRQSHESYAQCSMRYRDELARAEQYCQHHAAVEFSDQNNIQYQCATTQTI